MVIPQPSYPLFDYLAALDGVGTESYKLVYKNRWRISSDSLIEAFRSSARAVIAVNPNNPTGSFLAGSDVETLRRACLVNNVPLIIDEVFLDYAINNCGGVKSLSGETEILTFVLSGLSKVSGLPQMKMSWIVVNGPEAYRMEAVRNIELLTDMYLSVSTPVHGYLYDFQEEANLVCSLLTCPDDSQKGVSCLKKMVD